MKNNLIIMLTQQSFFSKKRTLILTVFAVIGAFFFIAATNKTDADFMILTPQQSGIKTIIFDLGNVLFTVGKSTHYSTLLPTILYNPMLLYWLTQIDPKESYFNFLETIPAESAQFVYNNGKKLPLICSDWMSGIKTPDEIKQMVEESIQKSDHATSVKNLFNAITNLMFVPQNLADSQELVLPMAALLKKFKESGYQICILSNWDAHTFKIIKERHSKLFDLCDQIVISGEEKISKPDSAIFQKLITVANLNPAESLFIDDEPYNTQAAAQLGFKTIQHIDALTTSKELISTGLVTLCQAI